MERKDPIYNRGLEDGLLKAEFDPVGWGFIDVDERRRYSRGYQAGKNLAFKTKRAEAKKTIVSALRIIVELQHEYRISPTEVLTGLSTLYLRYNFYHAAQECRHAAFRLREGSRG